MTATLTTPTTPLTNATTTTRDALVIYTENGVPKLYTGTRQGWEDVEKAGKNIVVKMHSTIRGVRALNGSDITCTLMTFTGGDFSVVMPMEPNQPFVSKQFTSSVLAWAAYYPAQKRLRVTFKSGRQYDYGPVEQDVAAGLFSAASAGTYYNAHIKLSGLYDSLHVADGVDIATVPTYTAPATPGLVPQGTEFDRELTRMRTSIKNGAVINRLHEAYKAACDKLAACMQR